MGTVDELGHAEEPKNERQAPAETPAATVKPGPPARQGDPFGASRTSEEFEPSVNNPTPWGPQGSR